MKNISLHTILQMVRIPQIEVSPEYLRQKSHQNTSDRSLARIPQIEVWPILYLQLRTRLSLVVLGFTIDNEKYCILFVKYICISKMCHTLQIIDNTKSGISYFIQIQWWKKPEHSTRTTDRGQATGRLYHLRLRVECTLFCNLQSRARTQTVLVIGLYDLLGNPTH